MTGDPDFGNGNFAGDESVFRLASEAYAREHAKSDYKLAISDDADHREIEFIRNAHWLSYGWREWYRHGDELI